MNRILFLIIPLFFCSVVFSQRIERINTLEVALQTETEHDKLVDIYHELASLYKSSDPIKARDYAQKGLTISNSIHYTKGTISALNQIGVLERDFANYPQALDAHYEALRINEEKSDKKGEATSYIYIGKVYEEQGDFESAQDYYNKSLAIGEMTKNLLIQSQANSAHGELQLVQGKNYLSLQYYLLAHDLIETTNETKEKAIVNQKVGDMFKLTGQPEKAEKHYHSSLRFFEELGYKERQAVLNFEIGKLHQNARRYDQALISIKTSLSLAEETGLKAYIKKGYQSMAEVYDANNDHEHAYEFLKYYTAIKDTREINHLEAQLELEKKEREIELLNREKYFRLELLEQEQFMKYLGFGSAIIVLILGVLALLSLKQKNTLNKQLQIATEDANRSRKEKEEFFAYTSHEIRTPLNAVVGMSKLLAETDLKPNQQKYLRTIKSSAQNILFLVNDVLDLSKIEAGSIELENVDFSLEDIIDEVIHSLSFKVREKNVELKSDIDPNLPEVIKGDPVRINQIILNLADNALKFTNTGEVKIKVKKIGDSEKNIKLHIAVSDTGIGIRKSKINSIFDSFKQETVHTTRQYGGTGLGLAITQQLIQLMGGEIQVDSTYGEGSTFHFELEFKKSKNTKLRVTINQDQHINLKDLKVLVVDDNALNREIFFDLINDYKNNVEVDMADDGKMAVQKVEKSDYDVVLMDIQMPRMDGYEATRYIRNEIKGPKSKIPIIAMTAHVLEGVAEKCDEAGMNDYVAKPINLKVLTQKIRQYVYAKGKETSEEIQEESTDQNSFNTQYVHLDELSALVGGNQDKIEKYINIFLKSVPQDLEALKEALEARDWETVGKTAHKMKGNVGYMGIVSIKEDLLELEKLKKEVGDFDEIADIVDRVEVVIELSIKELKELKNNLKQKI